MRETSLLRHETNHLPDLYIYISFDIGMNPKNDLPEISTCTTCSFSEDFSNYWTAVLYFKHQNGTFQRASQFQNYLDIAGPHQGTL